MRQMERSTRDFADWRKEREKEVMQLRRQVSLASFRHLHPPVHAMAVAAAPLLLMTVKTCPASASQAHSYAPSGHVERALPHLAGPASPCAQVRLMPKLHTFPVFLVRPCHQLSTLVCCVQGRKTAAQVQRLEALHAKQQAVLRRKTEEAEAARKRLHVSTLEHGDWFLPRPCCAFTVMPDSE